MFLAHLLKPGALHLHLIDPTGWKTKRKNFTPRILWKNYWKIPQKTLSYLKTPGKCVSKKFKSLTLWSHWNHAHMLQNGLTQFISCKPWGRNLFLRNYFILNYLISFLAWLGRANFKLTTRHNPCPCTRSVFACSKFTLNFVSNFLATFSLKWK